VAPDGRRRIVAAARHDSRVTLATGSSDASTGARPSAVMVQGARARLVTAKAADRITASATTARGLRASRFGRIKARPRGHVAIIPVAIARTIMHNGAGPIRLAALSGCMACTRSRRRWPTRRGGSAI
jgi:hypothetical protein